MTSLVGSPQQLGHSGGFALDGSAAIEIGRRGRLCAPLLSGPRSSYDKLMRIAILAIGSELLDGRVVDTNSNFIASELTGLGHSIVTVMQVDDVEQEIVASIKHLALSAEVIILSGGLGPTSDDLTRESVAAFYGRALVKDEATLSALLTRYKERRRSFDPSNEKQAYFPAGAQILRNPVGTAAGFYISVAQSLHLFSLPGVPSELKVMFKEELLPRLSQISGPVPSTEKRLGFKVFGLSEAAVGSRIKALELGPNYIVSYRASLPEIQVLIKSESPNLDDVVDEARQAVGREFVFCDSITQRLEGVVHELLIQCGKTVAVAESCTGGLLGGALSAMPGASQYFLGGVISYSNAAKSKFLNVPASIIETHGAVSSQTAELMASGARQAFGSDLALSITGIAGPDGGSAEKPVGTFFIGFSSAERTVALPYFFNSTREAVRQYALSTALDNLRRYLVEIPFRATNTF